MTNEFEYYLIERSNNQNYPLLKEDGACNYQHVKTHIENPYMTKYSYKNPVPRRVQTADYYAMPFSIVSDKIHDVLAAMNLKKVQLIPVIITGRENELYDRHWYIHIYNRLKAMDIKKSKCNWIESIQIANPIEKLVLNREYLSTIPLKDRLVFRLTENSTKQIYHASVAEAIMATNPEGLRFIKLQANIHNMDTYSIRRELAI